MREATRSHRRIAELAAIQHGVVSARQLVELGFSKDAISRQVATGRLHPVHHAVYAVGHPGLSRQGQSLAAVLSCGNGALLSHRSAAWLWGLVTRWPAVAEVTAVRPRQTRAAIRLHSAKVLQPLDQSIVEGIPVTAVPRTLLDFAAREPRFLGWALDRAQQRDLLDPLAIDELIARSRGFRGVARLRASLEIYRVPAFTRSRLERRFLGLVRSAGLPMPSMNCFVTKYELDAYWPDERFAVELDTYDHHGDPRAFEEDRLRHEDLKLAGIEMIRVTGKRMDREPEAVVLRLQRLLSLRRRELDRSGS